MPVHLVDIFLGSGPAVQRRPGSMEGCKGWVDQFLVGEAAGTIGRVWP
jgi:hypothetical protein